MGLPAAADSPLLPYMTSDVTSDLPLLSVELPAFGESSTHSRSVVFVLDTPTLLQKANRFQNVPDSRGNKTFFSTNENNGRKM